MRKIVIIGLVVISLVSCVVALSYNPVLSSVKSGESTLNCNDRVVDKEMVTDFSDGIWFFKDGYAKNCEILKG